MLDTPNAGGSSDNSEALSFEILHHLFQAEFLKTEMQIIYADVGWSKTDYLIKIREHKLGVSVTRAVGHPNPEDFTEKMAFDLLTKKLFGVFTSSIGVTDEDKWERQILHIWAQTEKTALNLRHAYQCIHPLLRGDTIVICTVSGNENWIYGSEKKWIN